MKIKDVIIPTGVAVPGMLVVDLLRECVSKDVPGLPLYDEGKGVVGKVSIRHIIKSNCIPDVMVKHSHLLGDDITNLMIPQEKVEQLLRLRIDDFVLPLDAVGTSETPLAKALAIMEKHDTTYMFIVDDGVYHGIVSIMGMAKCMIDRSRDHSVE